MSWLHILRVGFRLAAFMSKDDNALDREKDLGIEDTLFHPSPTSSVEDTIVIVEGLLCGKHISTYIIYLLLSSFNNHLKIGVIIPFS